MYWFLVENKGDKCELASEFGCLPQPLGEQACSGSWQKKNH
jgi:hypothetical protein